VLHGYRGELEIYLFSFFKDHAAVKFTIVAGHGAGKSADIFAAGSVGDHPTGSPGANAIVETIEFHSGWDGTFSQHVCQQSSRFPPTVFKFPAI
jgi:hypothetical protein